MLRLKTVFNKKVAFQVGLISIGVILAIGIAHFVLKYSTSRQDKINKKTIDTLISWNDSLYVNNKTGAYEKIEIAKALVESNKDHLLLGKILMKESSYEKSIHQYKRSISCCIQAINEFEKADAEKEQANAYYHLGDAYKKIGEYTLGFKATIKALNLYENHNNILGKRRCYNNIGSFFKYLENYPKALEYYRKALKISQDINYTSGIASAFNNIGTIYSAMGDKERALEFYNKSMLEKNTNNSALSRAIYYGNVAGIYTKQGKFTEALKMLNKAKSCHNLEFEPRNRSSHYMDFGEYYEASNKLDSAILYFTMALDIAKQYNFQERMLNGYEMLTRAYIKQHLYKEAVETQTAYLNLNEKLLNNQKSLEIARIQTDFEESNTKLTKDNALLKLYLLLTILLITIIFFIFALIHLKNKHKIDINYEKQIQETLEEEKSKVESNLDERNRELTFYSLQIMQQQETNECLVEKLQARFADCSSDVRKELQAVVRELERETNHRQIWEEFEHRFISVNPKFYANLIDQHQNLTQNERRLCAFLKLNMTTKEISSITGQTPHSINVARTRLRKKLGLSNNDIILSDYLSSI